MKKFLLKTIMFLFFLITAIGIIVGVFSFYNKTYPGEVTFYEGTSARDIADILEVNGNIKNADTFYYYIRLKEYYYDLNPFTENTFKPEFKNGTFEVGTGDFEYLISFISDFNNNKKESRPEQERFTTIPEGYSVEQTAQILSKKNIVNYDAFIELAKNQDYYEKLQEKYLWLPEYNSQKKYLLEGFLHPNTYEFETNSLPHQIIEKMLEHTNEYFENNKVKITESNFSFPEIITLASIVERESKFKEDRPKVARVFLNRLLLDMKLQSDITVLYSLEQHKAFVTFKDLEIDSPYNTYMYSGLPIGPIDSPSFESIDAVLNPLGEDFNYLYFYARPTGETFYSTNLKEHDEIRKKYEQEWIDLDKN
jgi:UPF0755 protein